MLVRIPDTDAEIGFKSILYNQQIVYLIDRSSIEHVVEFCKSSKMPVSELGLR